jgi:hypothetical protein
LNEFGANDAMEQARKTGLTLLHFVQEKSDQIFQMDTTLSFLSICKVVLSCVSKFLVKFSSLSFTWIFWNLL